jgi:hypothetical protein
MREVRWWRDPGSIGLGGRRGVARGRRDVSFWAVVTRGEGRRKLYLGGSVV